MNRRRFLKYAGASAVIVGVSALGLDYALKIPSTLNQSSQTTSVSELSSSKKVTTSSIQLTSLTGRLFFDYNGNGLQDGIEPSVSAARVQIISNKIIAEALTDSVGDYAFDDVPSGTYQVNIQADKRFRYVCSSAKEFWGIDNFSVSLTQQSTKIDIGSMEGYLTMALARGVAYRVNAYFDEGGDKNWMGQPNGDAGHEGTDFDRHSRFLGGTGRRQIH